MAKDPWAVVDVKPVGKQGASVHPWAVQFTTSLSSFTANPKREGTYQMLGPDGKFAGIPYSRVMEASKAGFKIKPEDRGRYAKDLEQARKFQPGYRPTVQAFQQPRSGERLWSAPPPPPTPRTDLPQATGPLASAVPGWFTALQERVQQFSQPKDQQTWNNFFRRVAGGVAGIATFPTRRPGALIDSVSDDPDVANAAKYKLSRMMPAEMTQDRIAEFRRDWAKDHDTALNNLAADITTLGLAHKAGKLEKYKDLGELRREAVNRMRETVGKEPVRKLVAEKKKTNVKIADQIKAIREENKKLADDYKAAVQKIRQERTGSEQDVALREEAERHHKAASEAYFAQEDAAAAKAKTEENAAWGPWHEKAKAATVEDPTFRTDLEGIAKESPEVANELRRITPEPGEEPPDSEYASMRANVMKNFKYGEDYSKLRPDQKAVVDRWMKDLGYAPESVDLMAEEENPSLERIHQAKSIIGWKLARREYPGVIEGAMKKAYERLSKAETKGSTQVGAFDDLVAGKKATQLRQEAFGRSRTQRAMEGEARKKGAARELYSEEQEKKRLAAAAKYDPSLVEAYKAVQEAEKHVGEHLTEERDVRA